MRSWLFAILLAASVLAAGCRTARYYHQAATGQLEILNNRRPIREMLADSRTDNHLKKQFELILKLRRFAGNQLQLPVGRQYASYVDLNREFVVWNVNAAPRFSLEPKGWRYPLVGKLTYRGFFNEDSARDYGKSLEDDGYDVYIGGVTAYSTLGWFNDPVLSTFIDDEEPRLASLLFHELAHQRLFVKGDTPFNEAFATAVARTGTRRWLEAQGKGDDLREFQQRLDRHTVFLEWVEDTRQRLTTLFRQKSEFNDHARLEGLAADKKAIVDALHMKFERHRPAESGWESYDQWFDQPVNNAQLNTITTYYQLVPAFERLLAREGGDLAAFYEEVRRLGTLKKGARHARLESILTRVEEVALKDGPHRF